jgi:hypothetical protein
MYTASVKSALRAIHKESGFRGFYQVCLFVSARLDPVCSPCCPCNVSFVGGGRIAADGERWLRLFSLVRRSAFVYCLAPQGCSAQLLRDLPLFAIMFASYEVLHDTYTYTFLARRDKFGKV